MVNFCFVVIVVASAVGIGRRVDGPEAPVALALCLAAAVLGLVALHHGGAQ